MIPQHKTKTLFGVFILLTIIPIAAINSMSSLQITQSPQQLSLQINEANTSSRKFIPNPGPDLGIANWTNDHALNPGFESWGSPYAPAEWRTSRNIDRYQWFATQPPWNVSQGTYSIGMQTRYSAPEQGWTYVYQGNLGADMRNLTLHFDYYADSVPSLSLDYFMLYVSLSDGRTIWYFIVGAEGLSFTNQTLMGYFQLNGPASTWDSFNRNITADYLALSLFPGSIAPGLEVTFLWFYIQTASSSDQWLRVFFDDVQLQNGTTTFIGSTTNNGDCEYPFWNPWYSAGNYDASHVTQSSTVYSGASSCNITAASFGNISTAQVYQYPRVRITNQNQGSFSLWWHLTQDKVTMWDNTWIQFQFYNLSGYFSLYYLLSYGDTFPYSNTSLLQYLHADGFNTTGSWQHFQCNPWQDLLATFGTNDAILNRFYITATSGGVDARINLLIDDVRFVARAVSDADYEDQHDPGSPILGWNRDYSLYFVVSDQGYGGGKAANCSLGPFGSVMLDHELNDRPLNSSRETYLDVMWRIEAFTGALIEFNLEFDNGRVIHYILGTNNWGSFSNSSMERFFNVTGSGTVGSWIQMHRDLVHDYETAFGSLPDVTMVNLRFWATADTNSLEVLFDDLYIYDDPAPQLSNHQIASGTPNHNDPVQVEVDAIDQDLDTVTLVYTNNSGSAWNIVPMTHQTGDTYRATIPGYPYTTDVDYYFEANDTWGMNTRFPSTIFSYSVDDTIDPSVSITSVNTGDIVSGMLDIDVTATDGESGMNRVEFLIDSTQQHTDYSAPYSYTLNTSTLIDGDHTITVEAYDNAGNMGTDSKTITTDNGQPTTPPPPPPPPAIPGFPMEALVIGLVGAFSFILVIRRRKSKK